MANIYLENKGIIEKLAAKCGGDISDNLSMFQADILAIKRGEAPFYLSKEEYGDIIANFSEDDNEAQFLEAELFYTGKAEVIHNPGDKVENHGPNETTGEFE